MAEYILFTPQPVVLVAADPTTLKLDVRLAWNVERWDSIDFVIALVGASSGAILTIKFLTGIQNETDDYQWDNAKGIEAGTSPTMDTPPAVFGLTVPASGKMLSRYIRWLAAFSAGSTAMVSISGMCRRRGA